MSRRRARQGSRAVVYVRTSHREQETLPEQEKRCRGYCEGRGWEVTRVVSDKASAWTGKDRPGWLKVEAMVEAGETEAVVVFQTSRAARNVGRLAQFIELCRANDVVFASASEGVDTSTHMGRMMAQIIGALAELESEIRSERTQLGLERAREEGRWTGGRLAFGFRIGPDKKLEPEPEQGALVREAASRFLAGEGLRTIAREWNSRGVVTQRGGTWSPTTVGGILSNPAHGGTTLTRRDHGRVLAKLERNAERMGPRGDRYLLTGLLRCGVCEAPMVGQPREGARRYICNKGPHDTVILADDVERIVTLRVAHASRDQKGLGDPNDIDRELFDKLNRAEERMLKFARDAAEAGMEPAEIRAGRGPLVAVRDRLQEKVDETAKKTPLGYLYGDDEQWGEEPTPEQWRAGAETLIDHVLVRPRKADGKKAPHPEARIVVRWQEGVVDHY